MGKTYFPFNAGPGANSYQDRWSKIIRECRKTGVLPSVGNLLQPYGDSTGMRIKLKSGAALMMGHRYENDEEEVKTIEAADGSYARIDRVVLHLDWVGPEEEPLIDTLVKKGTAAASPVAPELEQVDLSIWEIPLAQVYVGAGVVTITASDVTDERQISAEPISLAMILALS